VPPFFFRSDDSCRHSAKVDGGLGARFLVTEQDIAGGLQSEQDRAGADSPPAQ